jgi:hypothetical protein
MLKLRPSEMRFVFVECAPDKQKDSRRFNGVNFAVTVMNSTWQAVIDMPQLNMKTKKV